MACIGTGNAAPGLFSVGFVPGLYLLVHQLAITAAGGQLMCVMEPWPLVKACGMRCW